MGNQEPDANLGKFKPSLLIVDDEEKTRRILKLNLQEDYEVYLAENGQQALAILQNEPIHLVITDLRMPVMSGLELLQKIRDLNLHIPVIILTAFGTVENAVEAMKQGAYDYITKPVKIDELELLIRKSLNYGNLLNENFYLKQQLKQYEGFREIISINPRMHQLMELIKQVAQTTATVLIEGESGTGKELFARAIHYLSPRAENPFVEINCGAIPHELMESELFGHEKGAFTGAVAAKKGKFELADHGSLFLDEIGELPKDLQVKLLRALEEQRFTRVGGLRPIQTDVRFIAATNRNLKEEIRAGNFRQDLYYRLKVVYLRIPPLRERREDIPLLVQHFLKKHEKTVGKTIESVDPRALELLQKYDWFGNVRELENVIMQAMIFSRGPVLTVDALPQEIVKAVERDSEWVPRTKEELQHARKLRYAEVDSELEYAFLKRALLETGGNISEAARRTGYDRRQIQNLLKKYHLEPERFKAESN